MQACASSSWGVPSQRKSGCHSIGPSTLISKKCGGNCSLWQGTSQRVQVWSEKSNLSSVGCNLQGTATCRLQVHMGKARLKPDHCTYTSRSCGGPNTSKGSCCFLLTGKASVCADAQLTHAYIPLAQSRKEHYKVLITDHQSFRLSLSLSLSSIYEKRLRGRKIDTHPCQKSCSSRSNNRAAWQTKLCSL